jgi:hypothetical protein
LRIFSEALPGNRDERNALKSYARYRGGESRSPFTARGRLEVQELDGAVDSPHDAFAIWLRVVNPVEKKRTLGSAYPPYMQGRP